MTTPLLPVRKDWSITRLDRVASVKARIGWKALTAEEYVPQGYAFLATPNIKTDQIDFDNVNFITEFRYEESPELKLEVGDVLLVKDGNTLGITNLISHLPRPATVNGSIAVIRSHSMVPAFLRYVLASDFLQGRIAAYRAGMGVPHLFQADIKKFPLPQPPLSQQHEVADYLDAETARMDAVVAARRQVVELAGLRLDVYSRMRVSYDSRGLPYPLVPLRRRWEVIDCKHRTPAYQPEGFPIVSPGDAVPGRLDLSRCQRFVGIEDFADLTEGARRPRKGDIIYTRNASIGIASYVDTDESFSMGQDVCLIRSTDQDQRYLSYVLNTVGMDQLDEQKIGSTFSRINVARVLDLLVPCPPVDNQRMIADVLDDASRRTTTLVSDAERQITLVLERRQALISAAVTGQLEIPGVAA